MLLASRAFDSMARGQFRLGAGYGLLTARHPCLFADSSGNCKMTYRSGISLCERKYQKQIAGRSRKCKKANKSKQTCDRE